MRKKLFYSLSVAALLASCTSDEMIAPSVDGGEAQLAKRPVLGQVVLGEPATRIAITAGSFTVNFEEGDKIGACIVDHPDFVNQKQAWTNWSGTTNWYYNQYVNNETQWIFNANRKFTDVGGDPKVFYVFDEFISTNYPFTKQEGKWYSPANIVEGNYFFYAPYSANHLTRQKMLAVMPMNQNVGEVEGSMYDTKYKKQDAKVSSKAIEDFTNGSDPILIGYQFLSKSSNKPTAKTYNLYAYPMFTIVNDFNGYLFEGANGEGTTRATTVNPVKKTITIDKVEVYYNGSATNPIFYKAPFDFAEVNNNLSGNWDATNFTDGTATKDVLKCDGNAQASANYGAANYTQKWNSLNETRLAALNRADISGDADFVNHITLNVGKTLANGEKYHFHAVMPAGNYEDGLMARVYVTIDGKQYVMQCTKDVDGTAQDINVVEKKGWNGSAYTYAEVRDAAAADYNLFDAANGSQDVQLVRGQHFPLVEYTLNTDGTAKGTKAFAGSALTINLSKTQAFQLNDASLDERYGFTDNASFISYLEENIQRGVALTEIANTTPMNNWATGSFAFNRNHSCRIDAQLIKDLYNQTITDDANAVKLTLNTNLPIMNDVDVDAYDAANKILTFKASVDGKNYTYKVKYTCDFSLTNDYVHNGFNVVSSDLTLNRDNNVNAVVEITGGSVTLKKTNGINRIYTNANSTLKVQTNCGVKVKTRGGSIIMESGALTNGSNDLWNATRIDNDILAQISGSVNKNNVYAKFNAWPTANINGNTCIKNITITGTATQVIDQAQIDVFSNLDKVNITLKNSTGITSNDNVITSNINSLVTETTDPVIWTNAVNKTIVVTKAKFGNNWWTTFGSNITNGGTVQFQNQ